MSVYDSIRQALALHFQDNWKDGDDPRTPIAWPNVSFEPPALAPWVRLTLVFSEARRALLTGDRETGQRIVGLVIVQVFTPAGGGDGPCFALADAIADVWKERRIEIVPGSEPIVTGVSEPVVVGASREWFQVNVSTPFEYLVL